MENLVQILFIFFCSCYLYSCVSSLECQYCSTGEYDSGCRTGTETNLKTCTEKGEDHCYTEYIINQGKRPLYRRGCAPGNWCDYQKDNHGKFLKFCDTCQGDQCNNKVIGSNTTSLVCRSCYSDYYNSACRFGTVTETMECEPDEICVTSYRSTTRIDEYKRGCGTTSFCKNLKEEYGIAIEECYMCKYDLCNNDPLTLAAQ